MATFKLFNPAGDLFATAVSFTLQSIIRLASSLLLTRILLPESYGVTTVLMSIVFIVELIADMNVVLFVIREPNAQQPLYINTAWTIRLGRSLLNALILFLAAPAIASHFYDLPSLTTPLRVVSLWFVINGLESMSFPLAIRRKQARVIMYSELAAALVTTVYTLIYCYYSRDFWGMVYGSMLGRLTMVLISQRLYPQFRPRLTWNWGAAREILGFSKFTMPSSLITLALNQYDKVVFLRLFNLQLLGVYGLASNIANPIEALISKISQFVLYPRCAHNFREHPDEVGSRFYTENVRLFAGILFIPAAIYGAAHFLVALLFPARYAQTELVLRAFMCRACLLSLASPAEDLLIATGEYQVILRGNILRAIWIVPASIVGWRLFGFVGFIYGIALGGLPPLIYYLWLQGQKGLLVPTYEAYKILFLAGCATASYVVSTLLISIWPVGWVRG